jgi:transcriptional regulator with XRE-family HTH domain
MAKIKASKIDQHVGSAVRRRRTALGMSQSLLAVQLGVTYQQVQKYEKGTNRISASRLSQIARVLEVRVAFFFESAPTKPTSAKFIESAQLAADFLDSLATPEGQALMKNFLLIKDARLRRHIVDMVERIADVYGS